MLKKIFIFIVPLMWYVSPQSFGQDPLSSLNYSISPEFHPAFAGINEAYNFGFRLRKYSPVPDVEFSTMTVSTDLPFYLQKNKFGLGVSVNQDKAGGLNTSTASTAIAYDAPLGGIITGHHLRSGLQFMLTHKSLDTKKLYFEDQYTPGGTFNNSTQDVLSNPDNDFNFDLNFGILYYKSNPPGKESRFLPYLGAVMRRVNFSEKKNFGEPGDISSRYTIMTGGDWRISKSFSLKPGITYYYQGTREMFSGDLGFEISLPAKEGSNPGALALGASFRNEDATAFYIGLDYKNFKVAFASDYSLSEFNSGDFGAYEISVGFYIDRKNPSVSSFEKSENESEAESSVDTDRILLPFPRF